MMRAVVLTRRYDSNFTTLVDFLERVGWSVTRALPSEAEASGAALLLFDELPSRESLSPSILTALNGGSAHAIYLRAIPDRNHPSHAAAQFAAAGFHLATSEHPSLHLGVIRRPYGLPEPKNRVELENVHFPDGIWGGCGELKMARLEASWPYALCPEAGGFLPLLTAPLEYRLEPNEEHPFGLARRPYAFAGVKWRPVRQVLFACDMFSDSMIGRAENQNLMRQLLSECVAAHMEGELSRLGRRSIWNSPMESSKSGE